MTALPIQISNVGRICANEKISGNLLTNNIQFYSSIY